MNDQNLDDAYALRRSGDARAALEICHRIIAGDPANHAARSLAGVCFADAGDVDNARPLIEDAASADPTNWRLLINLSVLREVEGRPDDAIENARTASGLAPDRFETWGRLGELYGKRGDLEGASTALERAVSLNPAHPGLAWLLAGAAYETGRFDLAGNALDTFDAVAPGRPESLKLRAHIARKQNDIDAFIRAAERWLEADPSSEEARVALAHGHAQQYDYHSAIEVYRPLVSAKPGDANHAATYAQYLAWTRDFDGAEVSYGRALEANPDLAAAAAGLARLNVFQGKLDQAAALARRAIVADPFHVEAYAQLAIAEASQLSDEDLVQLHKIGRESALDPENRAIAWFTIGSVFHRRRHHDAAFDAWKQANDLKHDAAAQSTAWRYDRRGTEGLVDRLIAYFDRLPERARPINDGAPIPLFIVGMPRAGTTLLDSALSGHADISSGGELPAMPTILTRFLDWSESAHWRGGPIPETVIARMRASYLRQYDDYRIPPGRFVTDKQPMNILSVGLIRHLFPEAPIIHIRRNPLETGFSIYRNNFTKSWPFSTALPDIGHYYGQYARLMQHWQRVLGDGMVTVQYEELVDGFESELRRLLGYIGVEWDPSCLSYFESDSIVTTLSSVQVRKPPSKELVSSTAPYLDALRPLREALEQAGVHLS